MDSDDFKLSILILFLAVMLILGLVKVAELLLGKCLLF